MFESDSDMGIYDTPSWIVDFDPKSSLRDLKIKMITNDDIVFSIKNQNIDIYKTELDFIKKTCPNDIITGSLALNLYGLINREYNDIDVLIKDKNRYTGYYNIDHSYGGDIDFSDNRLGYKDHIYQKELKFKNVLLNNLLFPFTLLINNLIKLFGNEYNFKVDYFLDNDVRFNTFEYKGHNYKIHCPLQILEQKVSMSINIENDNSFISNRNSEKKHKKDLFSIFKSIDFEFLKKGIK